MVAIARCAQCCIGIGPGFLCQEIAAASLDVLDLPQRTKRARTLLAPHTAAICYFCVDELKQEGLPYVWIIPRTAMSFTLTWDDVVARAQLLLGEQAA